MSKGIKLIDYGSDDSDSEPAISKPTTSSNKPTEQKPKETEPAPLPKKSINLSTLQASNNLKKLEAKHNKKDEAEDDWRPTDIKFAKPDTSGRQKADDGDNKPDKKKKSNTLAQKFLGSLPKPRREAKDTYTGQVYESSQPSYEEMYMRKKVKTEKANEQANMMTQQQQKPKAQPIYLPEDVKNRNDDLDNIEVQEVKASDAVDPNWAQNYLDKYKESKNNVQASTKGTHAYLFKNSDNLVDQRLKDAEARQKTYQKYGW